MKNTIRFSIIFSVVNAIVGVSTLCGTLYVFTRKSTIRRYLKYVGEVEEICEELSDED